MRRRFRSAVWPLHRHSLVQLAIDAVLVAGAYFLAYRLRFDSGIPARYEDLLRETLPWVVPSALVVFGLFGLYSKHWRFVTQRDFVAVLQGVFVSTVVLMAAIAVLHPTTVPSPTGWVGVNLPRAWRRCSSCSRWGWSVARGSSCARSTSARCAGSGRPRTPAAC